MNARDTVIYWTGFTVVLVLLVVAPLALPEFWRRFLTEILIWGLLAMSSDLLIGDRKSTRLNSSHRSLSRMPSSA